MSSVFIDAINVTGLMLYMPPAAGKSTLLSVLKSKGKRILDTDQYVHRLRMPLNVSIDKSKYDLVLTNRYEEHGIDLALIPSIGLISNRLKDTDRMDFLDVIQFSSPAQIVEKQRLYQYPFLTFYEDIKVKCTTECIILSSKFRIGYEGD